MRKTGLLGALLAVATAPVITWSAVPEYVTDEAPPPSSVEERAGLLNEAFQSRDGEDKRRVQPVEQLWRDSTLVFRPRSYFFDREDDAPTDDRAWALGGSLDFTSGWWRNRARIVATLYTSQKVSASGNTDTTQLLQTNQDGITTLGQSYLEVKLRDAIRARVGRTALNLPYVNKSDSRMIPITHEVYGLGGNWNSHIKVNAAHVRKLKRRNDTDFISMSEAAGAVGTDDPLTLFGVRYGADTGWNLGAIVLYGWNVMNTLYTEGNVSWKLPGEVALSASAQYTGQESVGDELIGRFDT